MHKGAHGPAAGLTMVALAQAFQGLFSSNMESPKALRGVYIPGMILLLPNFYSYRLDCCSFCSNLLLALRIISSLLLRNNSALSLLLSDHEPVLRAAPCSVALTEGSVVANFDLRLYRVMRSGWSGFGGAADAADEGLENGGSVG